MKKIITGICLFAVVTAGCATDKIVAMGTEVRHDVFQEVAYREPVPAGYTILTVVSTFKTRRPGDCLWAKAFCGTTEYALLLNIDGQVTRIAGDSVEEETASRGYYPPEAGDGIRHVFRTTLRIKAGHHRLFATLPGKGVYLDREITLVDGTGSVLDVAPLYGKRTVGRLPGNDAVTSFYEGIRGFKGYLDGEEI